ncbi:MAG TPA: isocitrate lyase/phosphoenolpyruvate mutase family protein [Verrucomicrobiae bacterium]|nr:isocitrate lyase/phosphoenolpyruvate mutase family protein [Verrucomicrobiae bacterium]
MAISQTERARKFRALHKLPATSGAPIESSGPGAFIIPNPWDAGSARILAGLGFEALATTSAGFAFSLGRRDGAVTREEALAHCRAIANATDLPVAADLENCFGNDPKTVAETIRLAGSTGLVGGSVEDSSGDDHRPIYDYALAVERVAAAVEAARALPFPFTLTARAENFVHGRSDLDDTIRRLQAFAEAGADVLYAPGLPNLETIKAVCSAVAPHPVNGLAGMKGRAFSVADLTAAGVRRISLGGVLSRVAYAALISAAQEMQQRGTFTFVDHVPPNADIAGFMAPKKTPAGTA